ncbi:MAG TPA: MFS transporter [Pirellulales bacterium]|nr:MFS transporter [Pirellulales bacterium]
MPKAPGRLASLFAAMYFIEGIGEPSDGLLAQPMMALLKSWECPADTIASFSAALIIPWAFKPLYGALTDAVPLFGMRRKSYLIASSAVAALGFTGLCLLPLTAEPAPGLLLTCLLVPALGIAVADVVVDGLMVEHGQASGTTGRLQSIQWGAIYTAAVVTGLAGGAISEHALYRLPMFVCAITSGAMLWLALVTDEPPSLARSPRTARHSSRWGLLATVGTLIFLWHFNPFSNAVLYVHLTQALGFSESDVGTSNALQSVGSLAACGIYPTICRRLSAVGLMHIAIGLGILSTLAYASIVDRWSAWIVAGLFGLASTVATLSLLDLAARACSAAWAATTFAMLMALANTSMMLATHLGGGIYARISTEHGTTYAFHAVIGIGAATTAACWLLAPRLIRGSQAEV